MNRITFKHLDFVFSATSADSADLVMIERIIKEQTLAETWETFTELWVGGPLTFCGITLEIM